MKSIFFIIGALVVGVACISCQSSPRRSASTYFEIRGLKNYEQLIAIDTRVRSGLIDSKLFVGAYSLPENQAKKEMFHTEDNSWPLYGMPGTEFEYIAISSDYAGGLYWIKVSYSYFDRHSRQVSRTKAKIKSIIGPEVMKSVHVSDRTESFFPRWGDGT